MVQSSVAVYLVLCCLLFNCAFGLEKNNESDADQKTVKKRGIIHLGIHPHIHQVPQFHHHHVPKIPVVAKIPIAPTVFAKPFVPTGAFLPAPIPVTPPIIPAPIHPYHLVPGDATVTSFSATYPRFPIYTKTIVPAAYPHHHHHHFDPHFHHFAPKPIIPVAVPFPGIRQPKIPVFFNSNPIKPILFNPVKPHFHPIAPFSPLTPTFVPIPIPSHPPTTTINTPQPGISQTNDNSNLISTTQQTPQTEQEHAGNWQPIVMPSSHTPPLFNYHAHTATLSQQNSPSYNLISGQGQSVSSQLAQQLALYQHQHNLLSDHHHHHDSSYPYPQATYQAEKFTQNYDLPSNDGSFSGLSSYQVPLHQ